MCARFPLLARSEMLEFLFDIELTGEREVRRNIAPTQTVLGIVSEDGKNVPHLYRWGLVPPWADTLAIGTKMINAKSETVFEKPAFRGAVKSRRCAIPCSGFYEWRDVEESAISPNLFENEGEVPKKNGRKKPRKEPLFFFCPSHEVMAFAGLWERWRDPAGKDVFSCTILTTQANLVVESFHDRMPCLLTPDQVDGWIGDSNDPNQLTEFMLPLPDEMVKYKVMDSSLNDSRSEADLDHSETLLR